MGARLADWALTAEGQEITMNKRSFRARIHLTGWRCGYLIGQSRGDYRAINRMY